MDARPSDSLGVATGSASVGVLLEPFRNLLLIAALVLGLFALVPASASAEPLCTDTWTGASEGEWTTAANWSAGHAPGSTDVACIGAGKTAKVNGSAAVAGVVEGAGTVSMSGGSLEVANSLETGVIATFSETGGTLQGAGSLEVSTSLTWKSGEMAGSGQTVVKSGAVATLDATSNKFMATRLFVNEGTLTFSEGQLWMASGAEIKNTGTFNANSASGIATGSGTASIVNSGTFAKTTGAGSTGIGPPFESSGTVDAATGEFEFAQPVTLLSGTIEGHFRFDKSTTVGTVEGAAATVTLPLGSSLSVNSGNTATIGTLELHSTVSGAGTLAIAKSLTWASGEMIGSGTTLIEGEATGTIKFVSSVVLKETRKFVNEGTVTFSEGQLWMYEKTRLENLGVFKVNPDSLAFTEPNGATGVIVNSGLFEKTAGTGTTEVGPEFVNNGRVVQVTGVLRFLDGVNVSKETEWGGEENPSAANREPAICGEDVSCATGNLSKSETDFSIGGRGVGLDLTRTYNSQAAAAAKQGIFGYGWSNSFGDHLAIEKTQKRATLTQANGSTVVFAEGTEGTYSPPAYSQDALSGSEGAGYTLILPNQTAYNFGGTTGRLESVTDRAGNATSIAYNGSGKPEVITDPASRKLKLAYNGEGLVESVEDPMGHLVKYTYVSGSLASVTQPGETALRWQFKYDASHQLTELVDGRSGKTTFEYNASGQVVKETDPLARVTKFEYKPFQTLTTNEATGAVTADSITSSGLESAVTKGYATSSATTEYFTYDGSQNQLTTTDGNTHTTKYTYDAHGNRTSKTDPVGDKTEWTYNATHDVLTETNPGKETTTYEPSNYNPTRVSRPAPETKTQETTYEYNTHGQVTKMTDPLTRVWKYEYDTAGNKTAETDPEGGKRTWEYNADSYETATVSPRGHAEGAESSKFTITTERDAQGRPTKVTDPLKHETKYKYDGNGNLESKTDPEGNVTTYTYNADDERTKVSEPNKAVTETGYDGAAQITSQTDGNKHTTKYVRNVLEQVAEVVDPLERKTLKEYDAAGNLTTVTDPAKHTTTYKRDAANRLTEASYSEGSTHSVKYEYNANGDRTKMIDGTGTTTYEVDQLDRLTETKDGHGNTSAYQYDLANEQTKITYPNGKAVKREYDNAGRLKSVTDWSEHTTKFAYDADSDLKATTFPAATGNEDTYAYDETDAMKEAKMAKGAETLASLVYTRNKDGQVEGATSKGLPGEEKPAYTYDANSRLAKGAGTEYKYDEANNPTTIGTEHTYSYNAASELEKSAVKGVTAATYSYDELGERTKVTPAAGSATTYGYNQANDLTSVTRPKEGKKGAIEDTYGYNGDGLRTSQTISGTTTYLAWDLADKLPLILNDGTNSYIYGAGSLPIEQISGAGTTQYLHHDQQGSTRLLTNTTGENVGTTTYDAYGNVVEHKGTSSSSLGYDGQYTDADTGLIYLRARYYDPATLQFLTLDPSQASTGVPYQYTSDNPVGEEDPTGEHAKPKKGDWTVVRTFKVKPRSGRRSTTVLRVGSKTWGQTKIAQKHSEISYDAIAKALSDPNAAEEQFGESTTYVRREKVWELTSLDGVPIPIWRMAETRVTVNRETYKGDGQDAGIITAYRKEGGPLGAGESPVGTLASH
jgi:RHS repeat-associated protein